MPRKDFFKDKVVIVTGGASGMGQAVSEKLARYGARVCIADVNGSQAEAAAQAMRGPYPARARQVDVRDAQAVQAVVDEAVGEHGRLDYLFNNAGVGTVGFAKDMSPADWKRILDINLHGVVHGVQAAYPLMVRQGFGHIVNTASIAGLTPAPLSVAYAASKYAVVGLSISLRAEAAPLGVKVSAVCPGFIDTPMKDNNQYLSVGKEAALHSNPFRMHPVGEAARDILRGVRRNQAYIVLTPEAKLMWLLNRVSPALYDFVGTFSARAAMRKLAGSGK